MTLVTWASVAEDGAPLVLLTNGAHDDVDAGMCAMEAVAWLAGEPHSDTPACACPVVAAYLRGLNDALWPNDEARSAALTPWLWRVAGSRVGAAAERARAAWLAHRALTAWLPFVASIAPTAAGAPGWQKSCANFAEWAAAELFGDLPRHVRDPDVIGRVVGPLPYSAIMASGAVQNAVLGAWQVADTAGASFALRVATQDIGRLLAIGGRVAATPRERLLREINGCLNLTDEQIEEAARTIARDKRGHAEQLRREIVEFPEERAELTQQADEAESRAGRVREALAAWLATKGGRS